MVAETAKIDAASGAGGGQPPRHVAIIMDGNGRWATERGWPRLVGHRRGAERVKQIVRACPDLGVNWLTIYAFSTENWKRSTEEVLGLMKIFRRYIQREAEDMSAEGVRMRFIGDRSRLDPKLQRLMAGIEARTANFSRLNFTIAINYGGRDELIRATRRIAEDVAAGRLAPDAVTAPRAVAGGSLPSAARTGSIAVRRTPGPQRAQHASKRERRSNPGHHVPQAPVRRRGLRVGHLPRQPLDVLTVHRRSLWRRRVLFGGF